MSATSQRRPRFLALARAYVRRQLSKHFNGVYVNGLAEAQRLCREQPVIIAPNHVAWWDAFLAVLLDQALGTEGYCLMDARNLRRLPFFCWLGAIELARVDAAKSVRDLTNSLQLLSAPGRALWIFPQGEQRPPHLRPLALQSGVAYLAQKSHLPVIPVSISYAYLDAPQPRIVIHFGPAIGFSLSTGDERITRRRWLGILESRLIEGLNANDQYILKALQSKESCEVIGDGAGGYMPLVAAKGLSTDTPPGARLLARLAGWMPSPVPVLPAQENRKGDKR